MKNNKSLDVRISVVVERGDKKVSILWNGNEGLSHWLYKIMAIDMLVRDNVNPNLLEIEKTFIFEGKKNRADIYVNEKIPIWIECKYCSLSRLINIQKNYNGRLIHLDEFQWGSVEGWKDYLEYDYFDYYNSYNGVEYNDDDNYEFEDEIPLIDKKTVVEEFGIVKEVENWFSDATTLPV